MKYGFYIDTREAMEILISVLAISFAFTIVFVGLNSLFSDTMEFLVFMALSVVTVGSGFVLHEMGHKLVAIYYGAYARFQMWVQGLVFMLITSMWGILFAAPGAVYIYAPNISKRDNGVISIAGPFVNFLIMSVFFLLAIVAPNYIYFSSDLSVLKSLFGSRPFEVWRFGAYINFVLCMFNMIPAFPLDGSKVFSWSKLVWFGFISIMFLVGVSIGLITIGFAITWFIMLMIVVLISTLIFGPRR
jgi:Zn-dependent protease